MASPTATTTRSRYTAERTGSVLARPLALARIATGTWVIERPARWAIDERLDRVAEVLLGVVLGEQRERAPVHEPEAGRRVGDGGADDAGQRPRQQPHGPPPRPAHGVVAAAGEPGADHDVGVGHGEQVRRSRRRRAGRRRRPARRRRTRARAEPVARAHRAADAEVERQPHHHRARRGGAVGGGVGGAVVDDQHGRLRLRGPDLAHHAGDAVLLVQRGEDDEQLGRGDPRQDGRVHVLGGHRRATVTNSL